MSEKKEKETKQDEKPAQNVIRIIAKPPLNIHNTADFQADCITHRKQ